MYNAKDTKYTHMPTYGLSTGHKTEKKADQETGAERRQSTGERDRQITGTGQANRVKQSRSPQREAGQDKQCEWDRCPERGGGNEGAFLEVFNLFPA